jgi:hypothetical protein
VSISIRAQHENLSVIPHHSAPDSKPAPWSVPQTLNDELNPDMMSVLITSIAANTSSSSSSNIIEYNYSKQSKPIEYLNISTSQRWWMIKEVFTIPSSMKEQKILMKLYGSNATASSKTNLSIPLIKIREAIYSNNIETCFGELELNLSTMNVNSVASNFECSPVTFTSDDKNKSNNLSFKSTVTLRLLTDPPFLLSSSIRTSSSITPEDDKNKKKSSDGSTNTDNDIEDQVEIQVQSEDKDEVNVEKAVGTIRVVTWQGKNLNTDYPVYLETRMNQKSVRR